MSDKISAITYYRKWREKAITYLGGSCVHCGSIEKLEIDHIDRDKKEFNLAVKWSYGWKNLINELDKCQILCESCHSEKHAPNHGTLSRYRHRKCRCEECKRVWNEKTKEYKAKSRSRVV